MILNNMLRVELSAENMSRLRAVIFAKDVEANRDSEMGKSISIKLDVINTGLRVSRGVVDLHTVLSLDKATQIKIQRCLSESFGMSDTYIEDNQLVICTVVGDKSHTNNDGYSLFRLDKSDISLLKNGCSINSSTEKRIEEVAELLVFLSEEDVDALLKLRERVQLDDIRKNNYSTGRVRLTLKVTENRLILGRNDTAYEVHIRIPKFISEHLEAIWKTGRVELVEAKIADSEELMFIKVMSNMDYKSDCILSTFAEDWDFEINLGKTMDFEVTI